MNLEMQRQMGNVQSMIEETVSRRMAPEVQKENTPDQQERQQSPEYRPSTSIADLLREESFSGQPTDLPGFRGGFLSSTATEEQEVENMSTSEMSEIETSFGNPITTDKRIFVIGESHLGTHHDCGLQARLERAGVEVSMYEVVSGGTYRDQRVGKSIRKAVQETREGDVLLLVIGSNDTRDIAKEEEDGAIAAIRGTLENLGQQASEKRFQLVVAGPLPSPCYGSQGSGRWCARDSQDQPCEHEFDYAEARELVNGAMWEALENYSEHARYCALTRPFIGKRNRVVNRTFFKKNNIHLNEEGAEHLTKSLCRMVRPFLLQSM